MFGWLVCSLTAQSTLLWLCRAGQFINTLFLGRPLNSWPVLLHSFARNWQLSFLNQRKGMNDFRNFMISLHERMLPGPAGINPQSLIIRRTCIQLIHRGHLCVLNAHTYQSSTGAQQSPMAIPKDVMSHILTWKGNWIKKNKHCYS